MTPAERAASSRAAQELPPKIADPAVLRRVAGILATVTTGHRVNGGVKSAA
jgi:hypothetical protein